MYPQNPLSGRSLRASFLPDQLTAGFQELPARSVLQERDAHNLRGSFLHGLLTPVYFQFMEDTFASARSFSRKGKWTIKTDPNGPEFEV